MAFCNSCGASIAPGTKFCNKCGAAILSPSPAPAAIGAVPPVAPTPTPAPASGGGALKAILIVVGVIVLLGIVGVSSLVFFASRIAHRTRISQNGNNVKVETPFGTVETTKDPQDAAREVGVEIYPGARVLQGGAGSVTFGGMHSASLNLESSDSIDQVCSFYKPKFPNAMVTSNDSNQCTIVSTDQKNMITISVKALGGKTRIVIANVSKTNASPSSN
jgi:hypothetical protein